MIEIFIARNQNTVSFHGRDGYQRVRRIGRNIVTLNEDTVSAIVQIVGNSVRCVVIKKKTEMPVSWHY